MGYYTFYELKIKNLETEDKTYFFDDVIEFAMNDNSHDWTNLLQAVEGEQIKWYEHNLDMKKLSEEFKGVLFTLRGEGEESPDLWVKYFFNGKFQVAEAKISYEDFDKSKLMCIEKEW